MDAGKDRLSTTGDRTHDLEDKTEKYQCRNTKKWKKREVDRE
jgi:hypothetical protein